MSIEHSRVYSESEPGFVLSDEDIDLKEVPANPEVYRGCLVQAMRGVNSGDEDMVEKVASSIVEQVGSDFAMACGRCGITMVCDRGTVYGANRCPKVLIGDETLGELA